MVEQSHIKLRPNIYGSRNVEMANLCYYFDDIKSSLKEIVSINSLKLNDEVTSVFCCLNNI